MPEIRNRAIEYNPPRSTAARIVFFLVDIVLILLALRFFLRAFESAGRFADFILALSEPLTAPFFRVFPSASLSGLVIEWPTLFAMFAYLLLGLLVIRLVRH